MASQNPNANSNDGIQGTLDGAFFYKDTKIKGASATDAALGTLPGLAFDASRCSPVYGNSSTVQPAALNCKFCIKY